MSRDTDPSTVTCPAFLEKLRDRDQEAWKHLYVRYSSVIYGICRQNGLTEQESHDIQQQVAMAVFKKIDSFERQDKWHAFRGWMREIAKNKIVDQVRRKRSEDAIVEVVKDGDATKMFPVQLKVDLSDFTRMELEVARNKVEKNCRGERTWEIFTTSVLEGIPVAAQRFNIDSGHVRSIRDRVRVAIEKVLGELRG